MAGRIPDASPRWHARLLDELDTSDARAMTVTSGLTIEQLNWKSTPQTWSVGQCLEHLALANEVYVDAMAGALEGRAHATVDDITPGWFARWFIRNYVEPSAKIRSAPAPGKIVPHAEVDAAIGDRFLRSNDLVRAFAERARHVDVNRIRFKNPFVPVIRFTIGTGLVILPAHERRHLLQAERARASVPTRPS